MLNIDRFGSCSQRRRFIPATFIPISFLLGIICIHADVVYKDDTPPHGVPDFRQPSNAGVCLEVAVANCLWYFDHHGFPGVFLHSNGDPGTWQQDGSDEIDRLEKKIRSQTHYGSSGRGLGGQRGVEEHLKTRGFENRLKVKLYPYSEATYSVFQSELSRSQDVIPYFDFHKQGGMPPDEWLPGHHAQTAAGYDNAHPPTRVATTNGWDGWVTTPPPPHRARGRNNDDVVSRDNYDVSHIKDPSTNGNRLQIDQTPIAGIPPSNSDYIEMVAMMTICPEVEGAPGRAVPGTATPEPGPPPKVRYDYVVDNYNDSSNVNEPVGAIGISIEVPFKFQELNVTSPPGWTAVEWVPASTHGLATPAPFLDPDHPDAVDPFNPVWRGVLWTTTVNPVSPGDSLSGFSYELPDVYTVRPNGAYAAMSSNAQEFSGVIDSRFTVGPNCDDGDACTDDSADPSIGCVHTPNNAACDDGDLCNGVETCNNGQCTHGTPVNCDDGQFCTIDTCSPTMGSCEFTAVGSPPEIQKQSVGSDKETYSWGPDPIATHYDVVSGPLFEPPGGPGGETSTPGEALVGGEVCFPDLTGTSITDA